MLKTTKIYQLEFMKFEKQTQTQNLSKSVILISPMTSLKKNENLARKPSQILNLSKKLVRSMAKGEATMISAYIVARYESYL